MTSHPYLVRRSFALDEQHRVCILKLLQLTMIAGRNRLYMNDFLLTGLELPHVEYPRKAAAPQQRALTSVYSPRLYAVLHPHHVEQHPADDAIA